MIYKDNHVNMGGLVLCKKKKFFEKSYVFRWRREDKVYRSDRMFKLLTFIKKAIFIPHWNPVDIKEYKHLTGREFPYGAPLKVSQNFRVDSSITTK